MSPSSLLPRSFPDPGPFGRDVGRHGQTATALRQGAYDRRPTLGAGKFETSGEVGPRRPLNRSPVRSPPTCEVPRWFTLYIVPLPVLPPIVPQPYGTADITVVAGEQHTVDLVIDAAVSEP